MMVNRLSFFMLDVSEEVRTTRVKIENDSSWCWKQVKVKKGRRIRLVVSGMIAQVEEERKKRYG